MRSRSLVNPVRAFTLIELLTVIAIVGILAGILIPTTAAVRFSAQRMKTRVQFAQWSGALEAFKHEYGSYPTLEASDKVNGGVTTTASSLHLFHDLLVGRRRDGTALPPSSNSAVDPENQNFRRIGFLRFGAEDIFTDTDPDEDKRNLIHDAFGDVDIAVLVDRNLDGRIDSADYSSLPTVAPMDHPEAALRPSSEDFPASGVRAGVLFYCAPPGAKEPADLILSWK